MELNFMFLCGIIRVNISTFNVLVNSNVLHSHKVTPVAHLGILYRCNGNILERI